MPVHCGAGPPVCQLLALLQAPLCSVLARHSGLVQSAGVDEELRGSHQGQQRICCYERMCVSCLPLSQRLLGVPTANFRS